MREGFGHQGRDWLTLSDIQLEDSIHASTLLGSAISSDALGTLTRDLEKVTMSEWASVARLHAKTAFTRDPSPQFPRRAGLQVSANLVHALTRGGCCPTSPITS